MSEYCLLSDSLNGMEIPEQGILSRTLHNDDHVKIVLFGFSPGQELTAHTAPMPAMIQILKGSATLTLDADTHTVSQGCLVHMPPNLTHGIVANTPMLMLLTLVKAARQNNKRSA